MTEVFEPRGHARTYRELAAELIRAAQHSDLTHARTHFLLIAADFEDLATRIERDFDDGRGAASLFGNRRTSVERETPVGRVRIDDEVLADTRVRQRARNRTGGLRSFRRGRLFFFDTALVRDPVIWK